MKKILIVMATMCILSFSICTFAEQNFSEKIAGTYFITEKSGNQRIWTFFQDGNFLSTSSVQKKFGFSDQQGIWTKKGNNEVQGVMLAFGFDKQNNLSYTARITATIKFDLDVQTLEGQYSLRKYEAPENPMKSETDTSKPIIVSFKGKRLLHNQ